MKRLLCIPLLYALTAQAEFNLQQAIDDAKSGATVIVPEGTYTKPVAIKRGITLKGEVGSVLKIESNTPAILVDAYNGAVIDGLTIQYKCTDEAQEVEHPYAIFVRGGEATVQNCRFEALGSGKESPGAIMADAKAEVLVKACRFDGFEFPIQFWNGAEGRVEECIVLNPGHCGITIGHGSKAALIQNIVTGSGYHGIRCTGGYIEADSNLVIRNRNRGFYIGNRSAEGRLSNNLIVENSIGINVYANSELEIVNNVILRSSFAGLSIIETADLEMEHNIVAENEKGVVGFSADKEKEVSVSIDGRNLIHGNKIASENTELPSKTITDAPGFSNPDEGLFKSPVNRMGLEKPEPLQALWKKWQNVLDERG